MQLYRAGLALLFILSSISCGAQRYRNLVLEGGGVRGIAYAGAVQELEAHHITDSLRNIAGTSVGAIAGAALSVGYTARELTEKLYSLKIETFNDGRWIFFGGFARMLHRYGWYRGEALEDWVGDLVAAKTGSRHTTFLQLHRLAEKDHRYKDLYVAATNLSRQRAEVFSWQSHPDMELKTAVRASMSVPLYFSAVELDSAGHHPTRRSGSNCAAYVDGGLVMNYPMALFDSSGPNPATLGLKLERREQIEYFAASDGIAPYRIRSFRAYVGSLYNLTIETLNRKAPIADEAPRTIYISTEDVGPKVRRMSRAQKALLMRSGQRGATAFFKTHL